MSDTVNVHCLNTGEYKDVKIGSSLEELIDVFGVISPYLITNAKVNNKTESLSYRIYRPKTIEYANLTHSSAMRTYVRSLCFILAKAVNDTLPHAETYIEHLYSKCFQVKVQFQLILFLHS